MMSLDTTVVAHNNPLLRELQQGRKMRSLDALMNKLDEDQHRHVVHRSSVEQGLTMVHAAQATPTLITGGMPAGKQQQPAGPYMMGSGLVMGQSPLESSATSTPQPAGKQSHPDVLRSQVAASRPEVGSRNGVLPPLSRDDAATDRSPTPTGTGVSVSNASGAPARPKATPKALPPLQSQTAGSSPAERGLGDIDIDASQAVAPPGKPAGPSSPLKARHHKLADQEAPSDVQISRFVDEKDPELLRHDGSVMALALSPDGLNLVTGSDNVLTVWNVAERSRKWEAKVPNAVVFAACSPSGKHAACTTLDFSVTVWQLDSGRKLWTRAMKSQATALAFHPRLDALAIGETNTRVNVVSIEPLENIITIEHSAPVKSLSFSPDGALVAIAGGMPNDPEKGDGYPPTRRPGSVSQKLVGMRVCSVDIDNAQFKPVGLHTDVHIVAFAPSGEMLAVGIGKGQPRVAILTCADGFKEVMDLPVSGGVKCLEWSPASNFILCGGEDKHLTLWCLLSMTSQVLCPQTPEVTGPYRGVACLPDMAYVASCADGDKFVRLNSLKASAAPAIAPGPPAGEESASKNEVQQPSDNASRRRSRDSEGGDSQNSRGSGLVSPSNRESLKGAGTVKFEAKSNVQPKNKKPARKASIISIGDPSAGLMIKVHREKGPASERLTWMLGKDGDPALDLYRLTHSEPVDAKNLKLSTMKPEVPLEHNDEVVDLAFSPDGNFLFAGCNDSTVLLWNVETRTTLFEAQYSNYLKCVAYSRDGRYVAAGDANSLVHVYRTDPIAELGTAHVDGEVVAIDFTCKPDLLVVGTTQMKVMLVSIPGFDDLSELHHDSYIHNLSCAPNGRFVAVAEGSQDAFDVCLSPVNRKTMDKFPAKVLLWSISEDGTSGSYKGCISFTDEIYAMAFCPSGAFLAAGGKGCAVTLLVADKDFAKATDLNCAAAVRALAWTSDSQFLACGGEDMQVTVWSLLQQRVVFRLPKNRDWVSAIAFNPDSSLLATCHYSQNAITLHTLEVSPSSDDQQVKRNSKPKAGLEDETKEVVEVVRTSLTSLSRPVSSPMVSAGTVKWNAADAQQAHSKSSLVGVVSLPVQEAEEKVLTISVSNTSTPAVNVVQEAQPAAQISVVPETEEVAEEVPRKSSIKKGNTLGGSTLGLAPSGKTDLKSCGTVKMAGFGPPPSSNTSALTSQLSAALGPGGGGGAGSRRPSMAAIVGLGDLGSGFQIKVKNTGVSSGSVAKHITERKSVVASVHGLSAMFSHLQLCPERQNATLNHEDEIYNLMFGPNGKTLIAGGEDAKVILWDVEKQEKLFVTKMSSAVHAVGISPDGQYISAGDADGNVTAWRTDTFEEVGTVELEGSILSIAMCSKPDQFLAAGSNAKKVMLLAIPSFEEIADLQHDGDVHTVQFSPNGRTLAGGGGTDDMHGLMSKKSQDREMKTVVWKVAPEGEECKFLGSISFPDIVRVLAFSPSGKLLAVGSESRSITMLVVGSDFEKASELACPAGVRCLCWSADSRFLASGGEDAQISVWDLINENVIFQLPKAQDWYCCVAFSPASDWIAACGFGSDMVQLTAINAYQEQLPATRLESSDEEDSDEEKGEEEKDAEGVEQVTPTISAPTVSAPTVTAPTVTAPTVTAPTVTAPTVTAPIVNTPTVNAPAVTAPTVNTPTVNAPTVNAPTVNAPTVNAPPTVTPLVVTPSMPVKPSMPGGAKLGLSVQQSALPSMGTVKFGGPSATPQPPTLGFGAKKGIAEEDGKDESKKDEIKLKPDPSKKLELGSSPNGLTIATAGNLSRRPSNAAVVDLGSSGFQIKVQKVNKSTASASFSQKETPKMKFTSLEKVSSEYAPVKLPHMDEVMSLEFSPDGMYLVAGGEDCSVILWDVLNGSKKMEAQLSTGVKAVAYSPDGLYIAAAEEDSFAYVWATDTCDEIGNAALEGNVLSVALCAEPSFLAVGTTCAKVMLMTIPDFEEIADLRHDGHVHSIAFSPNGRFLAGGGGTDDMHGLMTKKVDGHQMKTVIWEVSTNPEDCKMLGQIAFMDIVHTVAFSPDGKILAASGETPEISLLEVDKDFVSTGVLRSAAGVTCLSWSQDSYFLVSAGEDCQITVWDVGLAKIVHKFPKIKDWYCSVAMSPLNSMVAACGFACNEVTLFSIQTTRIGEDDDEDISWPPSPASKFNSNVSSPPDICVPPIVNIAPVVNIAGEVAKPLTPTRGKASIVVGPASATQESKNRLMTAALPTNLQRRPSNAAVIDLGSDKSGFSIKVKNAGHKPTEQKLKAHIQRKTIADSLLGLSFLSGDMTLESSHDNVDLHHEDEVMDLAWAPNGDFLVSGGEDCCVVLWDAVQKTKAVEFRLTAAVEAVAYSPSGEYFAAADEMSFVYVWRASSREEVGQAAVEGKILSVALCANPDLVASGTTAKQVMLMSLPDFEEIAELRHDGHVHCLSFAPDSSMLAGGGGTDDMHGLMSKKSDDREMKTVIWSISAEGEKCNFLGSITFNDVVRAAAFSPSGKLLAVGGECRSITMLVVGKDFEKASHLPTTAGVRSLSWSNDSHYLASAGEDMQVSIWDLIKETVMFQYPKIQDWYQTVAFSPIYNWIASCGFGKKTITLFPIKRGEKTYPSNPVCDDDDEEEDQTPSRQPSKGSAPMAVPQVTAPTSATSAIQINAPSSNGSSGIQVNAPNSSGIQISTPVSPSPKVTPSRPKAGGLGGLMAPKEAMTSMGTVKFGAGGASPAAPPLGQGPLLVGGAAPTSSSSSGLLSLKPLDATNRRPSKIVELGDAAEGFQMKVKDTDKGDRREKSSKASRDPMIKELLTPSAERICIEPSISRSPTKLEYKDEVMSLVFSPDGSRIFAGGECGNAILWDIASSAKLMEVSLNYSIRSVAYCPQGRYIASGDEDCNLNVWNAETLEHVGSDRLPGIVLAVALCGEPQLVAAGTTEKKVVLYTLPNMEEIADLRHDGHVHGVAFSADGSMLAGGGGTDDMHGLMTKKTEGREMKTVIWRVSSDGEECKFLGSILFPDIVHATEFSPNGKLLAVGGENRAVSLLIVDREFEKATDLFCAAGVLCLSWSRDSQFLASGGEDMQVSVWDLSAEIVVIQLPRLRDWVCGVAFSPNCNWVAACGFGSTDVTLYPVEIVKPGEHRAHVHKLHAEHSQWIHGGKGGHAV